MAVREHIGESLRQRVVRRGDAERHMSYMNVRSSLAKDGVWDQASFQGASALTVEGADPTIGVHTVGR